MVNKANRFKIGDILKFDKSAIKLDFVKTNIIIGFEDRDNLSYPDKYYAVFINPLVTVESSINRTAGVNSPILKRATIIGTVKNKKLFELLYKV